MKWSSEEVAYWLTTIGMGKYLSPFIEQFVDGQILLNDLNAQNLVSELKVKSLHSPKMMREVDKLKAVAVDFLEEDPLSFLEVVDAVTTAHFDSFAAESAQKLETATSLLAEMATKYKEIESELEVHKLGAAKQHQHGPSQMSLYSEGPRLDSLSSLTATGTATSSSKGAHTASATPTFAGVLTADFAVNVVEIESESESVMELKIKELETLHEAKLRALEESARSTRSQRLSAENESTEKVEGVLFGVDNERE